jgi:hypothetical protein
LLTARIVEDSTQLGNALESFNSALSSLELPHGGVALPQQTER